MPTDEERARQERRARAEARRDPAATPIRRYVLGKEPLLDERVGAALGERVAEVLRLSHVAFTLTGKPFPSYKRSEMPGRVFRR